MSTSTGPRELLRDPSRSARTRRGLAEDVSPATGNFRTPLKGDTDPFLTWDDGVSEGYRGKPDVEHTVTGSPSGANFFSVSGGGLDVRNDLFSR